MLVYGHSPTRNPPNGVPFGHGPNQDPQSGNMLVGRSRPWHGPADSSLARWVRKWNRHWKLAPTKELGAPVRKPLGCFLQVPKWVLAALEAPCPEKKYYLKATPCNTCVWRQFRGYLTWQYIEGFSFGEVMMALGFCHMFRSPRKPRKTVTPRCMHEDPSPYTWIRLRDCPLPLCSSEAIQCALSPLAALYMSRRSGAGLAAMAQW